MKGQLPDLEEDEDDYEEEEEEVANQAKNKFVVFSDLLFFVLSYFLGIKCLIKLSHLYCYVSFLYIIDSYIVLVVSIY